MHAYIHTYMHACTHTHISHILDFEAFRGVRSSNYLQTALKALNGFEMGASQKLFGAFTSSGIPLVTFAHTVRSFLGTI